MLHPLDGTSVPVDDHAVLLKADHFVCALCGEHVITLADQRPLIMIRADGGNPNLRVISLEGKVLHVCPYDPRKEK